MYQNKGDTFAEPFINAYSKLTGHEGEAVTKYVGEKHANFKLYTKIQQYK